LLKLCGMNQWIFQPLLKLNRRSDLLGTKWLVLLMVRLQGHSKT
jgi:hypothetical protein